MKKLKQPLTYKEMIKWRLQAIQGCRDAIFKLEYQARTLERELKKLKDDFLSSLEANQKL